MIRTDGTPTIAWCPAEPAPEAQSCPVLTAPGRVKVIRIHGKQRPGVIEAVRAKFPDAKIIEVAD